MSRGGIDVDVGGVMVSSFSYKAPLIQTQPSSSTSSLFELFMFKSSGDYSRKVLGW